MAIERMILMVIGTFAYCGSGQDTLADGFCRYKGFQKFSLGDVIRDIAIERNLPLKRENLQQIREECDQLYGREYVPKQAMEKIRFAVDKGCDIIITGIRTIEEYQFFKKHLNMFLLFVYADKEIRFQRMINRACEKDEKNLIDLEKRMNKEAKLFDYIELEKLARLSYNFNAKLEEYLKEEEKTIDLLFFEIKMLNSIRVGENL